MLASATHSIPPTSDRRSRVERPDPHISGCLTVAKVIRRAGGERRFLFLQGPLSPLFRLIGMHIRAAGYPVHRVNLCAGDWLHWHGEGCRSFRGPVTAWGDYLDRLYYELNITDLVLHGDQRIYHRIAIQKAKPRGIQVAATELGVLRAGWMTIEKNGLSTLSHFPNDPDAIKTIAAGAGGIDLERRYPASFFREAVPDVIYNLTNVFFQFRYPHYQRHTIYHPVVDYTRAAWRRMLEPLRSRTVSARRQELIASRRPFFILPLQLEGDFQLRAHSPFESFGDVIDLVMGSFAEHAPAETALVLKSHPFDNGSEHWPRVADDLARRHGIADRLVFLDGGSLAPLIERTAGLVTLNSTAGLEAAMAGCPVKTLVPALFDISGITDQQHLDDFWQRPTSPDSEFVNDFVRAVALTIQERGSIHNKEGTVVAAANMAARLIEDRLNEPGGFVDEPPRLPRARAIGVPL